VRESVKEKKVQKRYDEEFKRQAVELVIHSGKTQALIARELGVSEYSLTLWKRAQLGHPKPAQLDGEQLSPLQCEPGRSDGLPRFKTKRCSAR
jgi:transposase-like protein